MASTKSSNPVKLLNLVECNAANDIKNNCPHLIHDANVEAGYQSTIRNLNQTVSRLELNIDLKGNQSTKTNPQIVEMIQKQLLVETWWRISCDLNYPPIDIISVISRYAESGGDRFDDALSDGTFRIRKGGYTLSLEMVHFQSKFAFGSQLISGKGIYRWKLLVDKLSNDPSTDDHGTINIGVRVNKKKGSDSFTDYYYHSFNGDIKYNTKGIGGRFGFSGVYGESYGTGDVVEVILNLNRHYLSFGKNGKIYCKQHIVEKGEYRLVVKTGEICVVNLKLLSSSGPESDAYGHTELIKGDGIIAMFV